MFEINILLHTLEYHFTSLGIYDGQTKDVALQVVGEESEVGMIDQFEEYSSIIPDGDTRILLPLGEGGPDLDDLLLSTQPIIPCLNNLILEELEASNLMSCTVVVIEQHWCSSTQTNCLQWSPGVGYDLYSVLRYDVYHYLR